MGDHAVTEVYLIQLKPDATIDDVGTEAHEAWNSIVNGLKKSVGCNKVFFGRQIENTGVVVLCAVWSSYNVAKNNHAPQASFDTLADSVSTHHLSADATAVLQAPTTEVFTGYGAEPGFSENVKTFAEKVDDEKPEGYLGVAHGEVLEEISKGPEGPKGRAVKLMIGWTSKDAHLEAKAKPGAIANNIGLLRELQKGVDLFHVKFKEV